MWLGPRLLCGFWCFGFDSVPCATLLFGLIEHPAKSQANHCCFDRYWISFEDKWFKGMEC